MSQSKKCIIILNGPSVHRIRQFTPTLYNHQDKYDLIAVNRWINIYQVLGLPAPDYVVVGKNSLQYNIPLVHKLSETIFYGIDKYPAKNYRQLKFGPTNVYGKRIDMKGALWWTGLYAIQVALKKEYEEIHVFGFTCTNQPDFADRMSRAPIKNGNLKKIVSFLTDLKVKGLMKKITFYEDHVIHPFRNLIFNNDDSDNENENELIKII